MHLACHELSFTYPGSDTPVFSSLDWSVKGPGFFSLFGLSGSGKTTLARLLSGELSPSGGTVGMIQAGKILHCHNSERLPCWNTVGAHLRSVTPESRSPILDGLIRDYGMEEALDQRFSGLSMGQKNRINLVRYLVQTFDLLIADEVLANVDEPMRHRILAGIKSLFPDKTFLYISHNLLEVARFSQIIHVIPQSPGTGVSRISQIVGLDEREGREIPEKPVQEKVYEILRAASRRENGR
jgi:ABC-type nitrate/sulfonate/bicarbonate transport system ATPase subunit